MATLEHFSVLSSDAIRTNYRLGRFVDLIGYRVRPLSASGTIRVSPGDTIILWVYWRNIQPSTTAYRAFIHLGENPIWAQQDDDPACRLPTSVWRAGQLTRGQFRLVVPRGIPIGRYPLSLGLYDPVTMERLIVIDEHGQPIGDSVSLLTVEVSSLSGE